MLNRFLGGMLMAAGLLIAGLAGLCCWAVLTSGGTTTAQNAMDSLPVIALFAALPLMAGIGAIVAGRYVWRKGNPSDPPGGT